MNDRLSLASLAALLLVGGQAAGQFVENTTNPPTQSTHFWEGWGRDRHPGYPLVYGRASTYQQGVLDGWGNYWQGLGQYNYWSAQAAVEQEQARAMYLENRAKALATRYELRRLREEARRSESLYRRVQREALAAKKTKAPPYLAASEFDAAAGTVYWPDLLRQDIFTRERSQLDRLFAQSLTDQRGAGTGTHHHTAPLVASMKETLKSQIHSVAPRDYLAAKRFLNGLQATAENLPEELRVARAPAKAAGEIKPQLR